MIRWNVSLRFFFLSVFLFLSFFLVVSPVFSIGVCCYNGDLVNSIRPIFADNCYEGEVEVGDFSRNPTCDYEYLHKGCVVNGVCYEKIFGNEIYDMPEIRNFFQERYHVDLSTYCDELIPFDSSQCSGSYSASTDVDTGNENNPDTGSSGDTIDYEDLNDSVHNISLSEDFIFCSSAGGPFNLFLTKDRCNFMSRDNSLYPCIYNPHFTGFLKTSSEQSSIYGLKRDEFGCMPKVYIKNCFDYKTEENCKLNPVWNDPHYKNSNLQSCKWINRSDYFHDFDISGGVCISNVISDNKNYNFAYFTDRMNLLKNPSFEDDLLYWNVSGFLNSSMNGTNGEDIIIESSDSYDGSKVLRLNAGISVFQNVEFLDSGKGYIASLVVKNDRSFLDSDKIELIIKEFYMNGSNAEFHYFYNLKDLNCLNDTFCKVQFNEHVIKSPVKSVLFILSSNVDVILDAVDFELANSNSEDIGVNLFKPVSIINSNASNCNLCFNKRGFNFCTREKSDLMGDCSYMVQDMGKPYKKEEHADLYLGKDENMFLNNWSSQSIPNAKLFCEMYLFKDQCLDPNNYVNSKFGALHKLKGDTLCKWSDLYGCFKDSDNSGGPDTIFGGKVFIDLLKSNIIGGDNLTGFSSNYFKNYLYRSKDGLVSDFAYSCDMIPPHVYLYITGRNNSLDNMVINNGFSSGVMLGDLKLDVEAYDLRTEACNGFNVPHKLIFDYTVNGKSYYKVVPSSYYRNLVNLKDFFAGRNGSSLLKDGLNSIVLRVKDQSGNVGKVFNFNLNSDVSGPNIELLSNVSNSVLGPNSSLIFKIFDVAGVSSCSYRLIPVEGIVSNKDIRSDFYKSSGNLFKESVNLSDDKYEFKLPIYNGTNAINLYSLVISCNDSFNQNSSKEFYLFVDYNTDLIVINPKSFVGKEFDFGYYPDVIDFRAVSDERLESCWFDFNGFDGLGNLSLSVVDSGFNLQDYGSKLFYTNISGNLSFNSSGIKNISVICKDYVGNKVKKNLLIYFDRLKPSLIDYNLKNPVGQRVVLNYKGRKYLRRNELSSYGSDAILELLVNGTVSYPSSDEISVFYKVMDNVSGERFTEINSAVISVVSFIDEGLGKINISNFVNLIGYIGEDLNDKGLFNQTYLINYSDKAGNWNSDEINLYFDNSVPNFVFSGDAYNYDSSVYSRDLDPFLNVTFNTPKYRLFNCSIKIPYYNGVFKRSFNYTNNLRFKISDIIPTFKGINKDTGMKFSLKCEDMYGVILDKNFDLYFDNRSPKINSVYFKNGNEVYLPNAGEFYSYEDIKDSLVFKMLDTNEKEYKCFYRFRSDVYDCNDSWFNSTFRSNPILTFETGRMNILSDSRSENPICYRDRSSFNERLANAANSGKKIFKTYIDVDAYCEDLVKLQTDVYNFKYNVNYVAGTQFVDFNLEYESGKVKFIVKSLTPFDKVVISLDSEGENVVVELTNEGTASNGLTIYKGEKAISYFGFNSNVLLWAIGLWNDGTIADRISKNMVIDNELPNGSLFFPDADENNSIYSDTFEVKIFAEDFGGSKVNKVRLFVNDRPIYSSNGSVDSDFIDVIEHKTYFSEDHNEFYGDLVFKKGEIGKTYYFVLEVTDGFGNVNETEVEITVKDGISIRLLDSSSAVVDFGGFSWITKNISPVIKFKTSRDVEKCTIYPFYDEEWKDSLSEDNIHRTASLFGSDVVDRIYQFDLSQFVGFNISLLSDKSAVLRISCLYNGKEYNFKRSLDYMNMLPDYVLSSSKGFVLIGDDITTDIVLKSVGANRYVKCKYALDEESLKLFSDLFKTKFYKSLDFVSFADGVHILKVVCEDKLGTVGPTKFYKFVINKNPDIVLMNVSLFKGDKVFVPYNDRIFFIPDFRDLGLSFKTNRKDISCSYEIEKHSGSLLRNIIYFIKNLFVSEEEIPRTNNTDSFFKVDSGLEFSSDGKNYLRVICTGNKNIIKEYEVYYNSSNTVPFDLDVSSQE